MDSERRTPMVLELRTNCRAGEYDNVHEIHTAVVAVMGTGDGRYLFEHEVSAHLNSREAAIRLAERETLTLFAQRIRLTTPGWVEAHARIALKEIFDEQRARLVEG